MTINLRQHPEAALKLLNQGYAWAVVAAYDRVGHLGQKGTLISKHRTYGLAEAACRKWGNWVEIVDLKEVE